MSEINDDASRITAAMIVAGYIKHVSGENPPAAKEAAVKEATDLFEMVLKELKKRALR